MRVLVTRPEADAAPLVEALRARDHEALIQPLLKIEPVASPPRLDLEDMQALLFTSANGVRAFAELSPLRSLPVLTVGDASGAAARAAGFTQVESAGGDVDDLVQLGVSRLDPKAGALLHAAGGSLAGDLKGALEAAGFAVRRVVLYNAQPAEALSGEVRAALAGGRLDAVLFFSPRTAETFVRLVERHGLTAACAGCKAVCLSAAVAARLDAIPWGGLAVAERPERSALLDRLDQVVQVGGADRKMG